MSEQHSLGWFRARLGNITGSQVGRLMKKGRNSYFGEDAMSYIYQLAAERSMARRIIDDDAAFGEYLEAVNYSTKAMQFGTDMEAEAREAYCFAKMVNCTEVGLCSHFDIPHFASSPDGVVFEDGERITLEIKCPTQAVFMRYVSEVKDNESLLRVKPEYFYQCMAHMMCMASIRTDFITYSPWQEKPLHIVEILPDYEVFVNIEERVKMANKCINQLIE